ncbi:two-component sensor histidine kinase [Paenibacillus albidus]|uniref:histidine kinase n=1 Tax=Paenibacillus albidus TaxID=2041023 RepID=A0A917CG53_9BACL|nr:HAMP domain-containing sensor histidine kinase [Paenibacillus albidus]GGF87543.1 two-component sensor histidine kinase [Paenibacillus albidus]
MILLLTAAFLLALLAALIFGFKFYRLQRELGQLQVFVEQKADTAEHPVATPNARVRIHNSSPALQQLAIALNRLLDRLQTAESRTQAAEAAHKRLVSNISHDLRTPMTSVLGYLEALQMDRSLSLEEIREFVDIAYRKSGLMHELLEAFFQLAKMEAGDMPLQSVPLEINSLVKEQLAGLYPAFQNLSLVPEIEFTEDNLYALGDRLAVERIVSNLLSNSLKYGSAGGHIGVRVDRSGQQIRLEVWDNGPGISAESLPFIFERLYTLESSRSSGSGGSGLGLTIARHLAEKLGGSLEACSVPGERTSFIMQLPEVPR